MAYCVKCYSLIARNDFAETEYVRDYLLVDCPNCGTKVATAIKCSTVAPAKHRATGYIPEFRVGIFECPTYKYKFRSKVDATSKPVKTNIKDLSMKVKEIQ